MKHNPAHYEELINLEGLDRRLRDDIQRFYRQGDEAGVELAQWARREAQNRMLQLSLEEDKE